MVVLIAVPVVSLIEIGLFVQLGGQIGLWPTLAWAVGSAAIGVAVVRDGGARTLRAVNAAVAGMSDPALPAADGAARLVAGALLIVPGFLTDALGLVLLVPPMRALVLRRLARVRVLREGPDDTVITARYRDVTSRADRHLPRDPPA